MRSSVVSFDSRGNAVTDRNVITVDGTDDSLVPPLQSRRWQWRRAHRRQTVVSKQRQSARWWPWYDRLQGRTIVSASERPKRSSDCTLAIRPRNGRSRNHRQRKDSDGYRPRGSGRLTGTWWSVSNCSRSLAQLTVVSRSQPGLRTQLLAHHQHGHATRHVLIRFYGWKETGFRQ